MIISDIRLTKRGRYALFSEDGFLFSLDGDTLLNSGIHKGSRLDGPALEALQNQSDLRKVKDAALRYLSLRAYGEQELYQKLLQRYDEHSAAAAVAQMCELGLLDDETFAAEKAKGMAERGKSPVEIRQKLYALGIERTLADTAVAAVAIDERALALELIEKKYTDTLAQGGRQKVMAALARRGFSYRVISDALESAMAGLEREEDNHWEEP